MNEASWIIFGVFCMLVLLLAVAVDASMKHYQQRMDRHRASKALDALYKKYHCDDCK